MIFLMPIYFIIACIVIYKMMKKYKGEHKWRRFFLLALLFYLPVGWDVILGRAYFYYSCNKDGGLHIYQTVKLGPEHWNEDGSPKFYIPKGRWKAGNFAPEYFDNRYSHELVIDRTFNSVLPVSRSLIQLKDKLSDEVLGEKISYTYHNGWVMETGQPFSVRGQSCPQYTDYIDNPLYIGVEPRGYRKFTSYIFLNSNNIKDDEL